VGTQTLKLNLVTHRTPRHSPYILTLGTQTLTLNLVTHRTPRYLPSILTVSTQTLTLNLVTHRTPRYLPSILTVSTQTLTLDLATHHTPRHYRDTYPTTRLGANRHSLKTHILSLSLTGGVTTRSLTLRHLLYVNSNALFTKAEDTETLIRTTRFLAFRLSK
jgi:hypothetical protein